MYTPFSEITWVVVNICILFTKAKSEKCPNDFISYIFMLLIRHFNPKLWRHNVCVRLSVLEFYDLFYHTCTCVVENSSTLYKRRILKLVNSLNVFPSIGLFLFKKFRNIEKLFKLTRDGQQGTDQEFLIKFSKLNKRTYSINVNFVAFIKEL